MFLDMFCEIDPLKSVITVVVFITMGNEKRIVLIVL